MSHRPLRGAGLGFRRELIAPLKSQVPDEIAFFELAPENWAGMGGKSGKNSALADRNTSRDARL